MPRINLLPVKAARRLEQARAEFLTLLAGLAGVFLVLYLWNVSVQVRQSRLQKQIDNVNAVLVKLSEEVKKVEQFKSQAQTFEKKLATIETLKKLKTGPARLLDSLATILTANERVWLTSMAEKKGVLTFEGAAMDHEDISDFQIALQKNTQFFSNVHLEVVNTKEEVGKKYLTWKIVCNANYAAF